MSPSLDQEEKNGSKLQETLNNGDRKNLGLCPYCCCCAFPGNLPLAGLPPSSTPRSFVVS